MYIIGVGHKKGVGKDTFADMLSEHLLKCNQSSGVFSFADELKDMAEELFGHYGLKSGYYYDEHRDEKEAPLDILGMSPRDIYLKLGLFMRSIDTDYWIKRLLHTVESFRNPPKFIIIPDVRFPNEVDYVRNQGGYLIKVVRPDVPDTDDAADCALDGYGEWWDKQVTNNADLAELDFMAKLIAQYLV